MYYLSYPDIIEVGKYFDIDQLLFIIITCLSKVSLILFLMRIPNSKRIIFFLWLLVVGLLVVNGTCAVVYILQCRPMAALWNPMIPGQCWSQNVYLIWGYVQGGKTTNQTASTTRKC